jgi:hypothetical protein
MQTEMRSRVVIQVTENGRARGFGGTDAVVKEYVAVLFRASGSLIVKICRRNGFVKDNIYMGLNDLTASNEGV